MNAVAVDEKLHLCNVAYWDFSDMPRLADDVR